MRFGELRYNRNLRQVYYITTPSPLSSGRLYESIICFPVDRRKEYIFEEKQQFNVLSRAYSYLFGLPVVICTSSGVIASDMKGEICGSSYGFESSIIVPIKKNYRVCQFKKRGLK